MDPHSPLRIRAFLKKRRYLSIALFVSALLCASWLLKFALVSYYGAHWGQFVETKSAELLARAKEHFVSVQRNARRIATDLAIHSVVGQSLENDSIPSAALFAHASEISRKHEIGVEVYDRHGAITAWEGVSGPSAAREVHRALNGQLTSYVTRSPFASHLFVVTPVRRSIGIIGAVLVRRTIEVDYPLSNKFIRRETLPEVASQSLGATVEFDFSEDAEPSKDGRVVSAELYGFDSTRVGIASVLKPSPTAYFERIRSRFQVVDGMFMALLILLGVAVAARQLERVRSLFLRSLAVTALIWITRYLLLWLEIPSLFFSGSIFDPAYYASKFGGGLAKSIGELTLTSSALVINIVVMARYVLREVRIASPWWAPKLMVIRLAACLAATALVFLVLRGYAAVIRSAVFDSALRYADSSVVIPSFELGLMVVNLFLISFSVIVVSVGLTSFLVSLVPIGRLRQSKHVAWVAVALLYLIAAFVFERVQAQPLISIEYRLLFAASLLVYTNHLHRRARRGRSLQTPGNILIALGLSALFFYPQLDTMTREKDRGRVQVLATEFLRPVDSWLTFVVDEALQSFAIEDTQLLLSESDPDEIRGIALALWARSSICREGYNCLFVLLDSSGVERSRFGMGNQSMLSAQVGEERAFPEGKAVRVEQVGTGVNAIKVYHGSVPIIRGNTLLGHGIVVVSAGQQTLFRGETPPFLRSTGSEGSHSSSPLISVAEFQDGELFAATSDVFPLRYSLPDDILVAVQQPATESFWAVLTVGDQEFDSYFVKVPETASSVIALCLPGLDLFWHLFNVVKVLVYYSIVVLLVLLGYLLLRWARGMPYRPTFRDKLLVALLSTAVLPLAVIAYYGKNFAESRLIQETAGRLEGETAAVAFQIFQGLEDANGTHMGLSLPAYADEIATALETDFNLYVDEHLRMTSRPELYEAGLLDRRLSGSAYAALMIRGERFHLQTENIGRFRYAVGYRSVVDERTTVLGVVSVPTLYRQDELEQEVSKQNAFLFGVYAVVLFVIVIVATTFANKIAAPIHRLTEATRRVAGGELDVRVRVKGVDGEVGELVRSFESMTEDLKKQREELVRFERELAWKEMAKQVAHEIKNPLTPMKLSLQHLRQTYRDRVQDFDRVFEEVSRTLIEQIDALSRIASEFSRFGRMPKARVQLCDVGAVLDEAARLFEQDQSVEFERTMDKGLLPVQADKEELRRAFINVIRNGVQAMGGKGRMVLSTTRRNRNVVVSFRDFGGGVPEEIRTKLFEPNFSTKTDGMGLGLAIVKKTIDDLGGTISIQSRMGEGTTVTIELPLKED